ncbi:hypothetical protein [Kitasatospora sp. HPMI-4]|uniref:hypothetical protein n=1 Tax=Kitasatospora sp. HPMI-4 TaxID=3448443 RepID=UPI003F1DBA10
MTRTRLHPRTAEGTMLIGVLGLLLLEAVVLTAVPAGVRAVAGAARRRAAGADLPSVRPTRTR